MQRFPIGTRTLKTIIAVYICFMIALLRGGGLPFYSAIAAILVMQKDRTNAKKVALNRIIGTAIGGIYAFVFTFIFQSFHLIKFDWFHYLLVSFALVFVIYTNVYFHVPTSVYISCVVFLSIMVAHGADASPYLFAWNRIVDTMIGIVVSLSVNLIIPQKIHPSN